MAKRKELATTDEEKREMYRLYLLGRRQVDIASQFGVSQSWVSECLKEAERESLASLAEEVKTCKEEQTRRYQALYDEAMAAWERSKLDAEKTTEGENDGKYSSSKTVEGQCGDPRFLAAADSAMASIRKIWGLDAPTKQEFTGGVKLGIVEEIVDAAPDDSTPSNSTAVPPV